MLSLCLCECGPHSPIATIPGHAIDNQLTANKDCIVTGCLDSMNFSVTKTPALNFITRVVNQQKTMKILKYKD